MDFESANRDNILEIWGNISNALADLEDMGNEGIDFARERLNKALEQLNTVFEITDEDVEDID